MRPLPLVGEDMGIRGTGGLGYGDVPRGGSEEGEGSGAWIQSRAGMDPCLGPAWPTLCL